MGLTIEDKLETEVEQANEVREWIDIALIKLEEALSTCTSTHPQTTEERMKRKLCTVDSSGSQPFDLNGTDVDSHASHELLQTPTTTPTATMSTFIPQLTTTTSPSPLPRTIIQTVSPLST